ncbi:MAG: recombination regulator RecX [Oscillospiraceae bacterium]|nr:recombination regulator RecX [Oscillospiraceae bacterium]
MKEPIEAAKGYAITLLSRRAYTEAGLYEKIEARYGGDAAALAVARMVELNLLDDEDYARRHLSGLMNRKGMSKRRAALELRRKGIGGEIIEMVTSEIEDDAEPMIARVIKRRYMGYLVDEKGRRKTVNALLRLGYSHGDVQAVLRNLEDDENYYENWE